MTMLRLRLRAWLAWGRAPDDLRVQSAQLFRAAWVGLVGFGVVMPLFLFTVGLFYKKPNGEFLGYLYTTGFGVIVTCGPLFLALMLYLLIPAVSYRRLASQGDGQPPTIISGKCYEAMQGKSDIFARIGNTAETALGHHLPLAWEAVVELGESEYELTVNPATGFVERLRRLGEAAKELRQYGETEIESGQADESYSLKGGELDEETGKATREQRRELKRLLQTKKRGWGLSPDYIGPSIAALLALGLVIMVMFIGLAVILFGGFSEPEARDPGLLILGGVGLFALATFGCAGYFLRMWWPIRNDKEPVQAEGTVVSWVPYWDLFSSRNESLVQLNVDGDPTYIFRIHRRWRDRVTRNGQCLRVTCLPISGYVEEVRIVE
jgi:hypothetical protein